MPDEKTTKKSQPANDAPDGVLVRQKADLFRYSEPNYSIRVGDATITFSEAAGQAHRVPPDVAERLLEVTVPLWNPSGNRRDVPRFERVKQ